MENNEVLFDKHFIAKLCAEALVRINEVEKLSDEYTKALPYFIVASHRLDELTLQEHKNMLILLRDAAEYSVKICHDHGWNDMVNELIRLEDEKNGGSKK